MLPPQFVAIRLFACFLAGFASFALPAVAPLPTKASGFCGNPIVRLSPRTLGKQKPPLLLRGRCQAKPDGRGGN